MNKYTILRVGKGVVYVLILLHLAGLTLVANYCFFIITMGSTEYSMRVVFFIIGLVFLAVESGVLWLLNTCIPAKIVFGKAGVPLMWIGWSMPVLSLISAVVFAGS